MANEKVFEIEIKSLLGGEENAERLLRKMRQLDPRMKLLHRFRTHLNHYFVGGDLRALVPKIDGKIDAVSRAEFKALSGAKNYSLRTRSADGKIVLVLKISRNGESSANGTNRVEFEANVDVPTISDLDTVLIASGFRYQAKWSRERREYNFFDITVTLDKNAGYGYLAEFELIEYDPEKIEPATAKLRSMMDRLGVQELDQGRLERMFSFYNDHWQDYYGTDKVFVVN